MASASTNDTAEGDDAVGLFFFVDCFTDDGDFKGSGHSEKVDSCFRGICRDFFDSVIDEGVGVFLVELCGNDCDSHFRCTCAPWLWWKR